MGKSILQRITPDSVESYTSESMPAELGLTGAEEAAAARFSDKRRRDFAHGRYCARSALNRLGIEGVGIGVGESREPLWPPGIVGSITHSFDLAAAAVCRDDILVGLGIDCEQTGRLNEATIGRVCLAAERSTLADSGFGPDHAVVLFSAKESVYKCIWPTVRRFVDFREVSITLDPESQRFSVAPATDSIDAELLSRIDGRWSMNADHVFTAACLTADPPVGA